MNKNDESSFDLGVIKIERLTGMMSISMLTYEINEMRKGGLIFNGSDQNM
jgi:hypothetical protein